MEVDVNVNLTNLIESTNDIIEDQYDFIKKENKITEDQHIIAAACEDQDIIESQLGNFFMNKKQEAL